MNHLAILDRPHIQHRIDEFQFAYTVFDDVICNIRIMIAWVCQNTLPGWAEASFVANH